MKSARSDFLSSRWRAAQAVARAYTLVYQVVTQQAQLTAYVHTFQTLSVLCLLCLPGMLLFRHVRAQRGAVAAD